MSELSGTRGSSGRHSSDCATDTEVSGSAWKHRSFAFITKARLGTP